MKRLAGILAVSVAVSTAGAQVADRASFYLVAKTVIGTTDTLIVERRTRAPGQLDGRVPRSHGAARRLTYTATLGADGLITRLSTRLFRTASDTIGRARARSRSAATASSSSEARRRRRTCRGRSARWWSSIRRSRSSSRWSMRARAMGGERAQFPIFIVGAPQVLPLTVTFIGPTRVTLSYAGVTMRLAVAASGQVLGGSIPAQRISITRGPALDALVAERRDYSAPAGAPYTAEDVVVHTAAGLNAHRNADDPARSAERARAGGRDDHRLGSRGPRRGVDGAQGLSSVS